MKHVHFLIFIANKGLLVLSKFDTENIQSRALFGVFYILSLIFSLFSVGINMFLISHKLINNDQMFFGISIKLLMSIFTVAGIILIFNILNISYKNRYEQIVTKQEQKYTFGKGKLLIIFTLIYVIPFLTTSLGLIFLRKLFYGN